MKPSPRLTIPRRARRFATALVCLAPCVATAAVLGEPIRVSAIGEPFRAEIAIAGDVARAGECLRVVTGDDESVLPWVRSGDVRIVGGARVVVSSTTPLFEPVVRLALQDVCDTRLRREYTLLLAFPAPPAAEQRRDAAEPAPVARTARARAESASRPAARATRTTEAPAARAKTPPRRTQVTATNPPARAQQTAPPPRRTSPTPSASRPARDDRLMLDGDAPPGAGDLRLETELASLDRIAATSEAEREQLRREQRMIMAVDRAIMTQIALDQRIRELEEVQRNMMEQAKLAAPPSPAANAPERQGYAWRWVAAFLAGLSLLLAAALLGQRRGARRHAPIEAPEPTEPRAPLADEAPLELEPPPPAWVRAEPPPLPDDTRAIAGPASAGSDTDAPPPEPGRATSMATEESAEEHESAIELAEIMIGFGRVQGAAETLAEFIQSNPKKAVTPWLKLLEVYRAAGLRPEFDALARQLNKTFNVKKVTWETFDEARAANSSLEHMPHVASTLTEQWRTRDCQAYLERLLRDNRDGTREGFPLSVIDEILVLAAILEDELGAYRPSPMTTA